MAIVGNGVRVGVGRRERDFLDALKKTDPAAYARFRKSLESGEVGELGFWAAVAKVVGTRAVALTQGKAAKKKKAAAKAKAVKTQRVEAEKAQALEVEKAGIAASNTTRRVGYGLAAAAVLGLGWALTR